VAGAPARWVAVALSGGRDSMALLHATVRASAPLGVGVLALHVHHGLMPQADAWLEFCRGHCAERAARGEAVRFAATRLRGRPARGESVEAWARAARQAALARMAREHGADLVLLAQHRRDQAETWMLQALRGGGAAGLAAMPRMAVRDGVTFARPWLDRTREELERFARAAGLAWVDDPSNDDPRFARNRLRLHVWPALLDSFPDAEVALAASARRAADAIAVADAVAAEDLDGAVDGGALVVDRWREATLARRANLLRTWLRDALGRAPPASLIGRLADELPRARSGACWPAGARVLRLHRGRLGALAGNQEQPRAPAHGATLRTAGCTTQHPPADLPLPIRRAGRKRAEAWRGALVATRVSDGGVALAWLAGATLRARRGGETFQLAPTRPPRSLKRQFQAAGIPAWERAAPLLWCGDTLVFVPGLGIDARARAPVGTPQVALAWLPDDAAP
jgi:tRNA(Ile)-lysidine synthase